MKSARFAQIFSEQEDKGLLQEDFVQQPLDLSTKFR